MVVAEVWSAMGMRVVVVVVVEYEDGKWIYKA